MKLLNLLACLAAASAALPSLAADSYTFDPDHTFPNFEVSHSGLSIIRGRFNKTQGKATIDMAGKTGSIEVTIDTASVDTGSPRRDVRLRGEDFFDVAKYPTMTFTSTKLKFDGDKLVGADGELTLLGVTKPVSLTIAGFRCADRGANRPTCGAEATTAIKRSDFGMKYGIPGTGDDIKIVIGIEARKGE